MIKLPTESKDFSKWGLAAVLIIFVLVTIIKSFYIVEEYERAVVTRLGEVQTVKEPGLQFKVPYIESTYFADTRVEAYEITSSVATKDNQIVTFTATVNHQIDPNKLPNIIDLYKQFGKQFAYEPRMLHRMAEDRIKSTLGTKNIDEIIPNREEMRMQAFHTVKEESRKYGINIVNLQLNNIDFGEKYLKNLERVAEARAKASEAAQLEREAEFIANKAIEQARGNAESKKLAAEAENYRITQTAQANAEQIKLESIEKAAAIEREGKAKAQALTDQARALNKNPEGLVELTKAEAMKNWDGTVPTTVMGNGSAGLVPFLNMNDVMKK